MTRYLHATNPETLTVPLAVLVALFGVTESAVLKAAREAGMPGPVTRGRYPLVDCVRWRLEQAAAAKNANSSEIAEARRRLYDAQRRRHELEMSVIREQLFDAELVRSVLRESMAVISAQLDGLAPRITPRLMAVDDPGKMQSLLFDECRSIRNATADALTKQLQAGIEQGKP